MCAICGCSDSYSALHHVHEDDGHHDAPLKRIAIEEDLLAENQQFALKNQAYFQKNNILALNLMSSPGSGKTTLIGQTVADLKGMRDMAVLTGDQETDFDALQIGREGIEVLQINTGRVCHLDAHMVSHGLLNLKPKENSILFMENIGNLVCPALFNLGEQHRVVVLSVTEGDNKPLKYPDMFRRADLMLITKMDLLPYVDFDLKKCLEYAKRINPDMMILNLSAKTKEGLSAWYDWLAEKSSRMQRADSWR
ncbi:hydrogenase nickel incorporation protein HypB [Legionella londiniensis]|uniref:Hydrogenase maturation factor HypB n=1 Tax=Legionella londiniensis TaxID=45068 RepID=A0A0W0VTN8_9GAMM|nr:hydrogenase nickel incorporation protein HypB [Legionella londiniensis]KTD23225.1 hydrogenase expression/formation protein HypB [Legionella londiniensis]STX93764.1 hydrogenase expression/formation protein HypB [Legionella londiniensis]